LNRRERPIEPGVWREAPEGRKTDRGYPVGPIKYEPVAPHTPWYGGGVCNASCCGVMVGIVTTDGPDSPIGLEPFPSPDGAFVLELSEHRTSLAVSYDPAIHAGWKRYAAHVCKPKEPR
jgi:hypothetical protein